jgi:hypothetical protein
MVLLHSGLGDPSFLEPATGGTVDIVKLSQGNSPLDHILLEIKKSMEEMARTQEEVGPPFSYGLITQEGFRRVE